MKKFITLIAIALIMISGNDLIAQSKKSTTEVLYFKANLACCKARACNAAEADIKAVVEKNFPDGQVAFREVKLDDPANKEIIERFNAQSQTLIVMSNTKKKENIADCSDILKRYNNTKDKTALENELVEKITATIL